MKILNKFFFTKAAILLAAAALAGCGYASISQLPNLDFSTVKASTKIMKEDPRTSVLIVDEFYDYLQNSLGLRLDENAAVAVQMRVQKAAYLPIYYDALGHAKSYRAAVTLEWRIIDARKASASENAGEKGAPRQNPLFLQKAGEKGAPSENLLFLQKAGEKSKQKVKVFTTKGEYIFNTNSLSALSDDEKSKALKEAATAALSEFASILGEMNDGK